MEWASTNSAVAALSADDRHKKYAQAEGYFTKNGLFGKKWRKAEELFLQIVGPKGSDDIYRNSLNMLGKMYAVGGNGIKQDFMKAANRFRQAVDVAHIEAHLNLADLYASGAGVIRNLVEAERLLMMAAEQGSEDARKRLRAMRLMAKLKNVGNNVVKGVGFLGALVALAGLVGAGGRETSGGPDDRSN